MFTSTYHNTVFFHVFLIFNMSFNLYIMCSFLKSLKIDSIQMAVSLNISPVCACSVAKSCPTLCYHMNCSPLGSFVHGIFQARILGWVAIFSSRESSQPRDQTHVSCIGRLILYHIREAQYFPQFSIKWSS